MKRKISLVLTILLLALAPSARAAEPVLLGEVAGAWYQTSVPGGTVQAGSMHVWFYEDGTCDAAFYMDEVFVSSGFGTWKFGLGITISCRFADEDGWTYTGNLKKGVLRGSFKGAGVLPSVGKIICSDVSVIPIENAPKAFKGAK